MDNARDVIEEALYTAHGTRYVNLGILWGFHPYEDAPKHEHELYGSYTDAIIAALTAAGYEIVQRDALLPPPGPSNIIVTQPSPLPAPKRVDDQ